MAAALITPLGVLAARLVVERIDASALALSSGAMIYVSATHLRPRAEREPRRFSLIALGAGILTAAVVVASKGWRAGQKEN